MLEVEMILFHPTQPQAVSSPLLGQFLQTQVQQRIGSSVARLILAHGTRFPHVPTMIKQNNPPKKQRHIEINTPKDTEGQPKDTELHDCKIHRLS